MKQDAFEALNSPAWVRFEEWLGVLDAGRRSRASADELARIGAQFPDAYREVCHHLALARARRYSFALQHRLNELALDGHRHLYRARLPVFDAAARFFANRFPATFRRYRRPILASALLFALPALVLGCAVMLEPGLVYSVVDPRQVAEIEAMYDPASQVLGREREADSDFQMFGYYIYNNISIGFQTFAGGLLFGIGAVFYLVFNGLFMGAIAGHLSRIGYTQTFWPFVAGHSAFELTAIVIFGGVGLSLGYALLAPGRRQRWSAVRICAVDTLPLVLGGTAMLVAAAFVEAYWSSTTWAPPYVKIGVGALLWLLTAAYFGFLGRSDDA